MRGVRVALVCTEKLPIPPIRGGAIQAYVDGIAPLLAREMDLTVISCTDPALPDREVRDGVRQIRVQGKDQLAPYYKQVAAHLEQERYDVVVVYNRPQVVLYLARRQPEARFILSMHNEMFHEEKVGTEVARAAIRRLSAIITVSRWLGHTIAAAFPEAGPKIRPIFSGVDLDRFLPRWHPRAQEERAAIRARLRLTGRKVILYTGRLSEKKGAHVLMRALGTVARTHPDAVLLVVGSKWFGGDDPTDPYVRRLQAYAHEHLRGRVKFTGWVPYGEIHRYYWAADLYACASQWQEPLARVHYEAMACGLPIITTRRGGNPEVVAGQGVGFVIDDYQSPEAFTRAIIHLLERREEAREMGRRARKLAETHFSWERVAGEVAGVLRQAYGEPAPG